jgi:hypothetical protein
MVSAPATGEPFEIALKLGFIASAKLYRARPFRLSASSRRRLKRRKGVAQKRACVFPFDHLFRRLS